LAGRQLELTVTADGLLVKPIRNQPRQEWEQQIREAMEASGEERADAEWLDAPLTTDEDWEW
jgi:antitoxin MazE